MKPSVSLEIWGLPLEPEFQTLSQRQFKSVLQSFMKESLEKKDLIFL